MSSMSSSFVMGPAVTMSFDVWLNKVFLPAQKDTLSDYTSPNNCLSFTREETLSKFIVHE